MKSTRCVRLMAALALSTCCVASLLLHDCSGLIAVVGYAIQGEGPESVFVTMETEPYEPARPVKGVTVELWTADGKEKLDGQRFEDGAFDVGDVVTVYAKGTRYLLKAYAHGYLPLTQHVVLKRAQHTYGVIKLVPLAKQQYIPDEAKPSARGRD